MEAKLNELLLRAKAIEKQLEKPKSTISRVFEVIEKLLIPIALLVLAYFTNSASIRISKSQLDLAGSQERRQTAEAQEGLQLKYVELFYQDVSGGDPKKEQAAIQLLRVMRPDLAEQMVKVIQGVRGVPPAVRDSSKTIYVPMKKSAGPLMISLQFGEAFATYSINVADGTRTLFGPFQGDNTNTEDDNFVVPIQELDAKSPSVRVLVTLLEPTDEKHDYSVAIIFRQAGVVLASKEIKENLKTNVKSILLFAKIVIAD